MRLRAVVKLLLIAGIAANATAAEEAQTAADAELAALRAELAAMKAQAEADNERNELDWFRSDYADPFGEFAEPTAVLQVSGAPTLRAVCHPKRKFFAFQLDNSGENRRIEHRDAWADLASVVAGEKSEGMLVKYAFGGERPKTHPMVLSEDGTKYVADEARGYIGSYQAERFARAFLVYDSLVLAVLVKGTDRAAKLDLTGDKTALLEIFEACNKKPWGRTFGKQRIAKP